VDAFVTVLLTLVFTAALTAWSLYRWLYELDEDPPGLAGVVHDLRTFRAARNIDAIAADAMAALREEAARWER